MNGHRVDVWHVLIFGIVVLPNVVRVGLPKAGISEHEGEMIRPVAAGSTRFCQEESSS